MFVLSSRYEGFPNVLIEAMACKCPSIAYDCHTGPGEIIIDGQNGFLVEDENMDELSKAIEKLYFDEEMQKRFSRNSGDFAKQLNVEMISKKWLKMVKV